MNFEDLIANYQFSDHLYLWLAAAFLLGLLLGIGWGRTIGKAQPRRQTAKRPLPAKSAVDSALSAPAVSAATPAATPPASPAIDGPRIGDLLGVHDDHINRLAGIGIESIDELLASTREGHQVEALADELQLEDFVIRKWARMAELLRIPELSPEVAEFLVFAGIGSTADLLEHKPESLAHKLQHLNEKEKRLKDVPGRQQIEAWHNHLKS